MTRNQVDALRNQEIERHNKFQESQDKIWRPVEAVTGAIGSLGTLAKGFGAWRSAGKSKTVNNSPTTYGTHYHFHGNSGKGYYPERNK